uniref:Uncharacterized protein n=1 Tax=Chromera velia CCMP2878 TaxID=1169474 RepID=A0A0G4HZX9_9ALVE|eukprot:Cvel_9832.t1-p1 / transcript=Cvel_9832.t1 / gene=Cvel_9832 / organism=Chromera_velia_CCMP2878 / gene_product=hypothetical protein / transcript_product=hypothetical protein / location=Cvel_scaffold578:45839-55279(-) / protein_length=2388 / sequence_SO=supercontig / SO=protein_coding / is_pseudo=false
MGGRGLREMPRLLLQKVGIKVGQDVQESPDECDVYLKKTMEQVSGVETEEGILAFFESEKKRVNTGARYRTLSVVVLWRYFALSGRPDHILSSFRSRRISSFWESRADSIVETILSLFEAKREEKKWLPRTVTSASGDCPGLEVLLLYVICCFVSLSASEKDHERWTVLLTSQTLRIGESIEKDKYSPRLLHLLGLIFTRLLVWLRRPTCLSLLYEPEFERRPMVRVIRELLLEEGRGENVAVEGRGEDMAEEEPGASSSKALKGLRAGVFESLVAEVRRKGRMRRKVEGAMPADETFLLVSKLILPRLRAAAVRDLASLEEAQANRPLPVFPPHPSPASSSSEKTQDGHEDQTEKGEQRELEGSSDAQSAEGEGGVPSQYVAGRSDGLKGFLNVSEKIRIHIAHILVRIEKRKTVKTSSFDEEDEENESGSQGGEEEQVSPMQASARRLPSWLKDEVDLVLSHFMNLPMNVARVVDCESWLFALILGGRSGLLTSEFAGRTIWAVHRRLSSNAAEALFPKALTVLVDTDLAPASLFSQMIPLTYLSPFGPGPRLPGTTRIDFAGVRTVSTILSAYAKFSPKTRTRASSNPYGPSPSVIVMKTLRRLDLLLEHSEELLRPDSNTPFSSKEKKKNERLSAKMGWGPRTLSSLLHSLGSFGTFVDEAPNLFLRLLNVFLFGGALEKSGNMPLGFSARACAMIFCKWGHGDFRRSEKLGSTLSPHEFRWQLRQALGLIMRRGAEYAPFLQTRPVVQMASAFVELVPRSDTDCEEAVSSLTAFLKNSIVLSRGERVSSLQPPLLAGALFFFSALSERVREEESRGVGANEGFVRRLGVRGSKELLNALANFLRVPVRSAVELCTPEIIPNLKFLASRLILHVTQCLNEDRVPRQSPRRKGLPATIGCKDASLVITVVASFPSDWVRELEGEIEGLVLALRGWALVGDDDVVDASCSEEDEGRRGSSVVGVVSERLEAVTAVEETSNLMWAATRIGLSLGRGKGVLTGGAQRGATGVGGLMRPEGDRSEDEDSWGDEDPLRKSILELNAAIADVVLWRQTPLWGSDLANTLWALETSLSRFPQASLRLSQKKGREECLMPALHAASYAASDLRNYRRRFFGMPPRPRAEIADRRGVTAPAPAEPRYAKRLSLTTLGVSAKALGSMARLCMDSRRAVVHRGDGSPAGDESGVSKSEEDRRGGLDLGRELSRLEMNLLGGSASVLKIATTQLSLSSLSQIESLVNAGASASEVLRHRLAQKHERQLGRNEEQGGGMHDKGRGDRNAGRRREDEHRALTEWQGIVVAFFNAAAEDLTIRFISPGAEASRKGMEKRRGEEKLPLDESEGSRLTPDLAVKLAASFGTACAVSSEASDLLCFREKQKMMTDADRQRTASSWKSECDVCRAFLIRLSDWALSHLSSFSLNHLVSLVSSLTRAGIDNHPLAEETAAILMEHQRRSVSRFSSAASRDNLLGLEKQPERWGEGRDHAQNERADMETRKKRPTPWGDMTNTQLADIILALSPSSSLTATADHPNRESGRKDVPEDAQTASAFASAAAALSPHILWGVGSETSNNGTQQSVISPVETLMKALSLQNPLDEGREGLINETEKAEENAGEGAETEDDKKESFDEGGATSAALERGGGTSETTHSYSQYTDMLLKEVERYQRGGSREDVEEPSFPPHVSPQDASSEPAGTEKKGETVEGERDPKEMDASPRADSSGMEAEGVEEQSLESGSLVQLEREEKEKEEKVEGGVEGRTPLLEEAEEFGSVREREREDEKDLNDIAAFVQEYETAERAKEQAKKPSRDRLSSLPLDTLIALLRAFTFQRPPEDREVRSLLLSLIRGAARRLPEFSANGVVDLFRFVSRAPRDVPPGPLLEALEERFTLAHRRNYFSGWQLSSLLWSLVRLLSVCFASCTSPDVSVEGKGTVQGGDEQTHGSEESTREGGDQILYNLMGLPYPPPDVSRLSQRQDRQTALETAQRFEDPSVDIPVFVPEVPEKSARRAGRRKMLVQEGGDRGQENPLQSASGRELTGSVLRCVVVLVANQSERAFSSWSTQELLSVLCAAASVFSVLSEKGSRERGEQGGEDANALEALELRLRKMLFPAVGVLVGRLDSLVLSQARALSWALRVLHLSEEARRILVRGPPAEPQKQKEEREQECQDTDGADEETQQKDGQETAQSPPSPYLRRAGSLTEQRVKVNGRSPTEGSSVEEEDPDPLPRSSSSPPPPSHESSGSEGGTEAEEEHHPPDSPNSLPEGEGASSEEGRGGEFQQVPSPQRPVPNSFSEDTADSDHAAADSISLPPRGERGETEKGSETHQAKTETEDSTSSLSNFSNNTSHSGSEVVADEQADRNHATDSARPPGRVIAGRSGRRSWKTTEKIQFETKLR